MLMLSNANAKQCLGKRREEEEEEKEENFGSQGCAAASGRQPKIGYLGRLIIIRNVRIHTKRQILCNKKPVVYHLAIRKLPIFCISFSSSWTLSFLSYDSRLEFLDTLCKIQSGIPIENMHR